MWCQRGCEGECHARGALMSGCDDEQRPLAFDRVYGHRSGYTILRGHDHGKFQADTIIGNVAMSVFLQAASWEML